MDRSKGFPLQDKILYDFYLGTDHRLHRRIFQRYQVVPAGYMRTGYRIFGNPGIINKTNEQLDRFVNGHYFSFTDDRDAAIAAMRAYHEKKIQDANAAIQASTRMLSVIASADGGEDIHD